MSSIGVLILAALLAAGFVGKPALAHAFLDHAVPAVGSTVAAAPKQVRMFFTEELEPHFSGATLSAAGGQAVATDTAVLDARNPMEMVLSMPPLAPGKYKVSWHAVSTDTHRTEGDFTFEIRP
ncbi:MAG TPA: copper homeostasis periplasmic binding protein CopC [Stellaceae bacterium]|nr:copper homeostasis periplasmic binding protein CopC [Stellaceae bacterium]